MSSDLLCSITRIIFAFAVLRLLNIFRMVEFCNILVAYLWLTGEYNSMMHWKVFYVTCWALKMAMQASKRTNIKFQYIDWITFRFWWLEKVCFSECFQILGHYHLKLVNSCCTEFPVLFHNSLSWCFQPEFYVMVDGCSVDWTL
jgi:hypothetical protein